MNTELTEAIENIKKGGYLTKYYYSAELIADLPNHLNDPHVCVLLGDITDNWLDKINYYKKAVEMKSDIGCQRLLSCRQWATNKDVLAAYDILINKNITPKYGNLKLYDIAVMNYDVKNYEKAFDYFTMSTKDGDQKAQRQLIFMYLNGIGTKKDISKALELVMTMKDFFSLDGPEIKEIAKHVLNIQERNEELETQVKYMPFGTGYAQAESDFAEKITLDRSKTL